MPIASTAGRDCPTSLSKKPAFDTPRPPFVVNSSPPAGSPTTTPARGLAERRTQCSVNEQTGTQQHFSLELKGCPSILTGDIPLIVQRNFNIRENQ
jgi:hypothetical protein